MHSTVLVVLLMFKVEYIAPVYPREYTDNHVDDNHEDEIIKHVQLKSVKYLSVSQYT